MPLGPTNTGTKPGPVPKGKVNADNYKDKLEAAWEARMAKKMEKETAGDEFKDDEPTKEKGAEKKASRQKPPVRG